VGRHAAGDRGRRTRQGASTTSHSHMRGLVRVAGPEPHDGSSSGAIAVCSRGSGGKPPVAQRTRGCSESCLRSSVAFDHRPWSWFAVSMAVVRNQLHGCRGEAPAGVQGQSPCRCGAPPGGALDMHGVSRPLLGESLRGSAGLRVAGRDEDAGVELPARLKRVAVAAYPQECSGSGGGLGPRAVRARTGVHLEGSCVSQTARGCRAAQRKPVSSRAMATTTLPAGMPFSLRCR